MECSKPTLMLYNGGNDQIITLVGLVDQTASAVTGATVTGTLLRASASLPSSSITFTDVPLQAGNYQGILSGFNATPGPCQLQVTGILNNIHFAFTINCNVVARTI